MFLYDKMLFRRFSSEKRSTFCVFHNVSTPSLFLELERNDLEDETVQSHRKLQN